MSLTPAQRAILRQVVIGSPDLDATTRELRESLGVARGFADPLLEEIGMADETIRVGPEAHLEVVAPLRGDVSLAAWLRKAGGGGGYALSIQVPDLTPHLAAAARQGVRVVADLVAYGHRIVQLHPGDMGLLIELDEIADPAAWFWDDIEAEVATAPRVDDVLAVEITSHDRERRSPCGPRCWARRWTPPTQSRESTWAAVRSASSRGHARCCRRSTSQPSTPRRTRGQPSTSPVCTCVWSTRRRPQ